MTDTDLTRLKAVEAAAKETPMKINVHEFAGAYEFRGDAGDYAPTDAERAMLEDFGESLLDTVVTPLLARIERGEGELRGGAESLLKRSLAAIRVLRTMLDNAGLAGSDIAADLVKEIEEHQQREPKPCNCRVCRDARDPNWMLTQPVMVLCPTCGNKRCPHATDHRFACTGSNEPGQYGSDYGERPAAESAFSSARAEIEGLRERTEGGVTTGDVPLPAYGYIPWPMLRAAMSEAIGSEWTPQESGEIYPGHCMVHGFNMNSLNRVVSGFADKAASCAATSARAEGWKAGRDAAAKRARDEFSDQTCNPTCRTAGEVIATAILALEAPRHE